MGSFLPMMLLGLIGAFMGNKYSQTAFNNSQSTIAPMAAASPQAPTPVQAPEANNGNNPTALAMDSAAKTEQEAIAARQKKNNDVLTSGLGVSGLASLQKSQLLGA